MKNYDLAVVERLKDLELVQVILYQQDYLDGEFVLTAKAVRGAYGGDRDLGAARMYEMMSELERVA